MCEKKEVKYSNRLLGYMIVKKKEVMYPIWYRDK